MRIHKAQQRAAAHLVSGARVYTRVCKQPECRCDGATIGRLVQGCAAKLQGEEARRMGVRPLLSAPDASQHNPQVWVLTSLVGLGRTRGSLRRIPVQCACA